MLQIAYLTRRPLTHALFGLVLVAGPVQAAAPANRDPVAGTEARPAGEPACAGESRLRFCDRGDGTVLDTRSGLLWLKDANCARLGPTRDGRGSFDEALAAAAGLDDGECGLRDGSREGDWRLPSLAEWKSILSPMHRNPALANAAGTGHWQPGNPFVNVRASGYWSSQEDQDVKSYAWGAGLFGGIIAAARKSDEAYIWPVRKP